MAASILSRPNILASERERLVAAARAWIGTPFHLNAAVKGSGVDCLRLIWRAHIEAGVLPDPGYDPWPHHQLQHSQNSDDEVLVEYVLRLTSEIEGPPSPGDIVLVKRPQDRVFAHAGLVTDWPKVIHVMDRTHGVMEGSAKALRGAEFRFFSVWANR